MYREVSRPGIFINKILSNAWFAGKFHHCFHVVNIWKCDSDTDQTLTHFAGKRWPSGNASDS